MIREPFTADDPLWPHETRMPVGNGYLAFDDAEISPNGVTYIRVLDANQQELAYWVYSEWAEEPENVLGAILGAAMGLFR